MQTPQMDYTVLSIPDEGTIRGVAVTLPHPVSAIQLVKNETGVVKLGFVTQLCQGTEVVLCGKGFNERTVKVLAHGCCYFVFRQDIDAPSYN
jgi:hypothetical protein